MGFVARAWVLLLPVAVMAAGDERVVESVLPALSSGPMCSATVALQNLSDRMVAVDVEAHKGSGALVPLAGHPEVAVRMKPGELATYKLQMEEDAAGAWIKVRERITSPHQTAVVAVGGKTECLVAGQVRTSHRQVAYPTRNPWFAGDTGRMSGDLISMINTGEHTATAWLCYSTGGLYSVPGETRPTADLKPICSTAFAVQVPPFGSRQFPVEREGSSYFSLKTEGNAIVLDMLHPLEANVALFAVDSTVTFGGEVPQGARNGK